VVDNDNSEADDAYDEYYDVEEEEEDMSEEQENDVRLSHSERDLEEEESDLFAASYDDRSEANTAVGDEDAVAVASEESPVDLQLLEESEEVFVDIMTNNDHDELNDDNDSMEDPVEAVNANTGEGILEEDVGGDNYELFESDNEEELIITEEVGDTVELQSMEDLATPVSIDGEVDEDEGEVSEEERTVMEKEEEEEEDLVFSETAMENDEMEAEEEDEEDEMLMEQAPPRMEDEDSAAFVDKMELADAYDDGETTAGGGGGMVSTGIVDNARVHEEEMINMEEATSLIEEAVAVADEVQQEQDAAAAAKEKASLATPSTYGSIQEDSPSTTTTSVQYMITLNMRRVLVDELGYLPREVKHMRPDVAAVVVDKMLKRPSSGMPTPWYVDESKAETKSDNRRLAIKRVLKQVVFPACVAGATIALGARAWGTLNVQDDVPLLSTNTQQPQQHQPSNKDKNPASSIVVKSMSYAAPEPGDPNYPKAYDKPIRHSVAPTFGLKEDTEKEKKEVEDDDGSISTTPSTEEYERETDEKEEDSSRRTDRLDVKRNFPYQKDLDETWLDRVISFVSDGVFRKTI